MSTLTQEETGLSVFISHGHEVVSGEELLACINLSHRRIETIDDAAEGVTELHVTMGLASSSATLPLDAPNLGALDRSIRMPANCGLGHLPDTITGCDEDPSAKGQPDVRTLRLAEFLDEGCPSPNDLKLLCLGVSFGKEEFKAPRLEWRENAFNLLDDALLGARSSSSHYRILPGVFAYRPHKANA